MNNKTDNSDNEYSDDLKLKCENEKIKNENTDFKNRIIKLENENNKLSDHVDTLEDKVGDLENLIIHYKTLNKNLQEELQKDRSYITDLQQFNKELNTILLEKDKLD